MQKQATTHAALKRKKERKKARKKERKKGRKEERKKERDHWEEIKRGDERRWSVVSGYQHTTQCCHSNHESIIKCTHSKHNQWLEETLLPLLKRMPLPSWTFHVKVWNQSGFLQKHFLPCTLNHSVHCPVGLQSTRQRSDRAMGLAAS